jgi:multiple sugar transport system substrate-binding protein
MKRLGLIFVVGVAVMLVLSLGLSIPDASAQAKLTIMTYGVFTPGTNDLFKQQVQDWAKAKGVTAEVEFISIDNLLPKAAAAAETGVGPDIAFFPHSGPNLLAEKLVDMDDIANELGSKLGGWVDVAKQVSVVGGHWKAVPYFGYVNALVYRRDLIQEIANEKVPETWEDVVRIGKKLRAMGHPVGFALGHATGDANDFVYSVLWAYGAKEVEKDGKTIAINSPETKKALEFIARLYKEAMPPGVLGWDDSSNNRMFLAGVLSLTNNSASIYWATRKDAPALRPNTSHAIFPSGPAGRAQYTQVYGFGVFKYNKNLELAKDLIRYLMAPEQYAKWLESGEGNMLPLLSTYAGLPMWTKDPNLKAFAETLKYARAIGWPGPVTRAAAEVNAKFILVDMAARAAKGMPVQKSIDEAVSEMKEIYARH